MMIRLVVTTASLRRRRVAITAYIIIAFVKNIKRNKSKNTKTKFETKFKLPSSSVCKNRISSMLQNDDDKKSTVGMVLRTSECFYIHHDSILCQSKPTVICRKLGLRNNFISIQNQSVICRRKLGLGNLE